MNLFVIAKRELGTFFASPIAYLVGAGFLFITGFIFVLIVTQGQVASLFQLFNTTSVVLLFVAPILTMRLVAEEARSGTLELLMTAPVRDWEVITGKFLAAFLFLVAMIAPTLLYLVLLVYFGQPDVPVTLASYMGLLLLGATLISFGVLTSAMSTNQIVAAVLGVALSLGFWLVGGLTKTFDGPLSYLFEYISFQEHLRSFTLGLVSTKSVVYFLSATAAALFLATRILEVRRWR